MQYLCLTLRVWAPRVFADFTADYVTSISIEITRSHLEVHLKYCSVLKRQMLPGVIGITKQFTFFNSF